MSLPYIEDEKFRFEIVSDDLPIKCPASLSEATVIRSKPFWIEDNSLTFSQKE